MVCAGTVGSPVAERGWKNPRPTRSPGPRVLRSGPRRERELVGGRASAVRLTPTPPPGGAAGRDPQQPHGHAQGALELSARSWAPKTTPRTAKITGGHRAAVGRGDRRQGPHGEPSARGISAVALALTMPWPTSRCAYVGRAMGTGHTVQDPFRVLATASLSGQDRGPLEKMETVPETGTLATNLAILKRDNKCFLVLVGRCYYGMLFFSRYLLQY